MGFSLLITLREGLEAGLIVAITLAYLGRVGQSHRAPAVWAGVAVAFLGSIALGAGLELTARELSGSALDFFEGAAMLFAVVVLTTMVFWMRARAATIGRDLRSQVDRVLGKGSTLALALLAFSAVGREGIETVLFLFAGTGTVAPGLEYWGGAAVGLLIAAVLAGFIYAGGARLPLSAFFNVTGVALIVLAAGMLSNGLMELHEVGVVPDLGPHVWDTYGYLKDNSDAGRFAATLFGYTSSPFLGQLIAYVSYVALAGGAFVYRRDLQRRSAELAPAAAVVSD